MSELEDDRPVALDDELDRLFQVSPAAFVGERNVLAKTLRSGGDKEAGDRVAALARPTPVAWAINQLHFTAQRELDALRESGKALRQAQESLVDAGEFAARRREHQEALRAASEHAAALAEEGNIKPNAGFLRRLEATLNLFAAAAEDVSPGPGRMSAELEPMGFDTLTAVLPAPQPRPKRELPVSDTAHAEKLATVKAALDAVEKEVRRLEREAEASEARLSRAARDADEARERAVAMDRARDEARTEVDAAMVRLDAARRELDDARRAFATLKSD